MKRLLPLSLAALAALSCAGYAAEPTASNNVGTQSSASPGCRRLARAEDEKIQLYCAGPGGEATNTPTASAATSCRRFVPQGDTKIQRYCGNVASWDAFDRQAVASEVTCRWAGAPEELCLSPAQWESFDRQPNRPQVAGADASLAPAPSVDAEVIVSADRTLAEMRKQILAVDERFLAKYNELNTKPEYAIKCTEEASTGSRFRNRTCKPEFANRAVGDATRAWLRGTAPDPGQVASITIGSKTGGYQQNMRDVASKSPELLQLAQDRANLEDRYNRLLRRAFGSKD